MHVVTSAFWSMMRHVEMFGPRQWLVFTLVAVAIGLVCMRGFGNKAY